MRFVRQPTKYQKIHWTASKGLNNTGAIRFVKGQQKNTCTVTLTISYEVPQVLLLLNPYPLCAVWPHLVLARLANRPLTVCVDTVYSGHRRCLRPPATRWFRS